MLKRYLDFINESLDLIIESNVIYSDKFRLALTKCNDYISRKLLEIENKDLDVKSNYFDIVDDKNDTVSFIPDKKAQKIISDKKQLYRFIGIGGGWLTHNIEANGDLFDALGYEPEGDVYRPEPNDLGEIIKKVVSPESGKTYAYVKFQNGKKGVYNTEKLQLVDDSSKQVWSNNRQEIKIGRVVRSLLKAAGETFKDKDIEEFVNKYKATIDKMNDKFSNFEVVTGDDIAYWYNIDNYSRKSGTLGNSCMASKPSEYFQIYTENPEECALVIYKDPDNPEKICGRALLWTLSDGKKFMDRIYTIKDSDVQLFRDFAKENGWYYKYNNNSSSSNIAVAPNGEKVDLNLTIYIKSGEYSKYPYVDTLKYYTPETGRLSYKRETGSYTLEGTSGEYITCYLCDGSGIAPCYDCDGDGKIYCDECEGNGVLNCYECGGNGDVDCYNCEGSGEVYDDDDNKTDCDECFGSGKIHCGSCDGDGETICGDCEGSGKIDCKTCNGSGNLPCGECV